MRPTVTYIEQRFREFNREIFRDELPDLPIKLSNAQRFLGKLCYKKQRSLLGLFGKPKYTDFVLWINTKYDLDEREVEDTIIHEMIHYYIAYKGIEDTSTHGRVFRTIMKEINQKFGRHITISYKMKKQLNLIAYSSAFQGQTEAAVRANHKELFHELDKWFDLNISVNTNEQPEGKTLIFISSGGTEGLVVRAYEHLLKPVRLLTDGKANSLAASLELACWIRQQGDTCEILHDEPKNIVARLYNEK